MGTRLKMNPKVSVSDLCDCLGRFMTSAGSRDLLKLLEPLSAITWKQNPRLKNLVDFQALYTDIYRTTGGCRKLGHKALYQAVISQHHSDAGACLFGHVSLGEDVMALKASFRLRCLLSKYRDLDNADVFRVLWDQAYGNLF